MPIEPTKADLSANPLTRLNYKPAQNFPYRINGNASEKAAALERVQTRYADAIEALRNTVARNLEDKTESDRILQDYYCIGCDISDGRLRAQVLSLAACPLLQAAMREILGQKLTLQCYFPQTYEEKSKDGTESGLGPGGIIGTLPANSHELPDTSASRCYKYGRWVGDTYPLTYTSEDEASAELWRKTFESASQAKKWLMQQQKVPPEGIPFPQEYLHEMFILLGVAAMRQIVSGKLHLNWVLLNANRVTLAEHLHWSQA